MFSKRGNFCKDHREKIEASDPVVVEDLISDKLNNRRKLVRQIANFRLDSMLSCVCSITDHRSRQNVVRTSVTHSDIRLRLVCPFLFLPYFDVICDLLLNRRTGTWNIVVK